MMQSNPDSFLKDIIIVVNYYDHVVAKRMQIMSILMRSGARGTLCFNLLLLLLF